MGSNCMKKWEVQKRNHHAAQVSYYKLFVAQFKWSTTVVHPFSRWQVELAANRHAWSEGSHWLRFVVSTNVRAYFKHKPRKGGFSKGGFCKVQCHAHGNKKMPKDIGPSSTFGTQSVTAKRGIPLCRNPLLKTPFSWFLNISNTNICG